MLPDPAATNDKPPRSALWIPLSLRLLVAMLLLAGSGGLVWIGWRAYRQHAAILEIERAGGKIFQTRPRGPDWLRAQVGESLRKALLDDVLSVDFRDSEVSDRTLAQLNRLPQLQSLWLHRTAVTDAGMKHLARMDRLTSLGLAETHVGDTGLAHLAGLNRLEYLGLGRTDVTDAGLRNIHGLTRLKRLSLEGTRVSGAGLLHLKPLNGLQFVYVDESQVADEDSSALQRALPNVNVVAVLSRSKQ